jgi:hypothetical protein
MLLPRTPHSFLPLAVAAVSRLARRPASAGLALTRRPRPRPSSSEEGDTSLAGVGIRCSYVTAATPLECSAIASARRRHRIADVPLVGIYLLHD